MQRPRLQQHQQLIDIDQPTQNLALHVLHIMFREVVAPVAHPTLFDNSLWMKMPAAVDPSLSSTSTRMPTASPMNGSTMRTHGSASRANHLLLKAM